MTPAYVWTAIAVVGFLVSGWNLISAWGDYRSGRNAHLNGMRQIAAEAHVALSLFSSLGSALAAWLGAETINAGGGMTWSRGIIILVVCVGCLLATSVVVRVYRYRISRYDE